MADDSAPLLPVDLAAALRLFDETTTALAARVNRLEEVLTAKQAELVRANAALSEKVGELDRLRARLELVMGAVASGVVAVDADGRVTTANPAARGLLAEVLPQPIGADWRAACPESPVWPVLAGAPSARSERALPGPGGRRLELVATASALRGTDGALLGAVEVFEEVSALRRLQEQAQRADRLKQLGEMAAGVAHEIRNPLNGIEGFASLLVKDLEPGDRRRRYAELVVQGVRDLNQTVSGLLEFTRTRRIERRPTDPGDLARAVAELCSAAAGLPPVVLRGSWPGGRIDLDGQQLKQVLINLVQNAQQAALDRHPGAGRVELEVSAGRDGGLAFVIDDDGPGVPVDSRQLIFTPFHTTKDHGTGLGLAIAHTIVALHGGSIQVGDAPLGGARFTVAIPGA